MNVCKTRYLKIIGCFIDHDRNEVKMDIHEYQAKEILRKYNINVPSGGLALSADAAVDVAKNLHGNAWVVKAQVHAGGRGKAGGIKLAKSIDEVHSLASQILGMRLVTKQTGKEGKLVSKVYIESASEIDKEYYLSLVLDRNRASIAIIFSLEGGMDIEEVAHKTPDKIIKVHVDPAIGLQDFHIRKLAFGAGFDVATVNKFASVLRPLYKAFLENDASQVEINPLIVSKAGDFIALDAKFNFDSSTLFRHKDIAALDDIDEKDPLEARAESSDLNYVRMEGNIGCMVNGAGLAMATMDIIKLFGGSPANFLDIGGGADTERVRSAFDIIVSDSGVRGILINIFGGIVKCDIVANGVIQAMKGCKVTIPVVVRFEGTNADAGREVIEKAGISNIQVAENLSDATQKIVNAIK